MEKWWYLHTYQTFCTWTTFSRGFWYYLQGSVDLWLECSIWPVNFSAQCAKVLSMGFRHFSQLYFRIYADLFSPTAYLRTLFIFLLLRCFRFILCHHVAPLFSEVKKCFKLTPLNCAFKLMLVLLACTGTYYGTCIGVLTANLGASVAILNIQYKGVWGFPVPNWIRWAHFEDSSYIYPKPTDVWRCFRSRNQVKQRIGLVFVDCPGDGELKGGLMHSYHSVCVRLCQLFPLTVGNNVHT